MTRDGLVFLILNAHFVQLSLRTSLLHAITTEIREIHHMRRYTFQPSVSDTRQAKQSSQPADISHLGSKSQENKPLENVVHQTFLRREVKQQVSWHSNQENERQETKHAVPLPVLNPKYSSIQPTSDPVPPLDQFFKPQEATCAPFHPTYMYFHRAHNYLSSAKS